MGNHLHTVMSGDGALAIAAFPRDRQSESLAGRLALAVRRFSPRFHPAPRDNDPSNI